MRKMSAVNVQALTYFMQVWLKGKEFHPQGGKNSPGYMGHIDDCIVSSCH